MAAGTVISGGFPGRIAQEVQTNPKCNGCLHFDGQAGRTGACTIGERPWNCGDGDAADIGYAPIARGAGSYLPGMSNHDAQAHEVETQEVGGLYGAGSTRPVTFQQVSLGEEHVHFIKSMVDNHTALQRSMCRLCKSSGAIGTAPPNVGYQVCTCTPIAARDVAKALEPRLSNRQRSVMTLDDAIAFVYDVAKAGYKMPLEKASFYHQSGRYDVSAAGGGEHHVDFHPHGGGQSARVGTFGSPGAARSGISAHVQRFAQGSGKVKETSNTGEHTTQHKPSKTGARTLPSMHRATSIAKKSDVEKGERLSFHGEDDMAHVDHPRSWVSHAHTSHGAYQLEEPGMRTGEHARLTYRAHDGSGHVTTHPSVHEAAKFARQHHAEKTGGQPKGRQASATFTHHFEATHKSESVEKAINNEKHSHIVTGPQAPHGRGFSSRQRASTARDKMDNIHGSYAHHVGPNPNFKPPAAPSMPSPPHEG